MVLSGRGGSSQFFPLENFVYGRGLEHSEYLKRSHSIPVVVTIFMYPFLAKFGGIMKGWKKREKSNFSFQIVYRN
jgi:hypothetical protein